MRQLSGITLILLIYSLFFIKNACAQVQINATGNYIAFSSSDKLPGAGINLRYFVKPQFTVGIGAKYFADSRLSSLGALGSFEDRRAIVMYIGEATYLLTSTKLQPYVGVETGLYRFVYKLEQFSPSQSTSSVSVNSFDIAPKVGLQYAITPIIGLCIDAGYHFTMRSVFSRQEMIVGAGAFFKINKGM